MDYTSTNNDTAPNGSDSPSSRSSCTQSESSRCADSKSGSDRNAADTMNTEGTAYSVTLFNQLTKHIDESLQSHSEKLTKSMADTMTKVNEKFCILETALSGLENTMGTISRKVSDLCHSHSGSIISASNSDNESSQISQTSPMEDTGKHSNSQMAVPRQNSTLLARQSSGELLVKTSKLISIVDLQVPCTCQSSLLPYIQGDEVHFVAQADEEGTEVSHSLRQLKSYSLVDGKQRNLKTITNQIKKVSPVMSSYSNSFIILGGDFDDDSKPSKLGLYQLNEHGPTYTWELLPCSMQSSLHLELMNSLCISCGNEKITIVSILNQVVSTQIVFHVFFLSTKSWKSAYLDLNFPELCNNDGRKYQIQSCIAVLNFMYCSILLQGSRAYVCKVDLTPLQECSEKVFKELSLQNSWSFELPLLQKFFLCVFNEEVIAVAFKNDNSKSVVEVRWESNHFLSPLEYQLKFPAIMKVVTASVISDPQSTLVIIYHDDRNNNCYAKKLSITI